MSSTTRSSRIRRLPLPLRPKRFHDTYTRTRVIRSRVACHPKTHLKNAARAGYAPEGDCEPKRNKQRRVERARVVGKCEPGAAAVVRALRGHTIVCQGEGAGLGFRVGLLLARNLALGGLGFPS